MTSYGRCLSWILAPLVPIIVLLLDDKKARPFIKYNAIQALVLVWPGTLYPQCFLHHHWLLHRYCRVGYVIYLAIQSYQGNWVTIPVVTDFCKSQGWID